MPEAQTMDKLFSSIAPRYDFLNHFLSLNIDKKWRKRLVRRIQKAENLKILDLCTGTGDLAIEFAKTYPDCDVTALDVSQRMLDFGIAKAKKNNCSNRIRFIQGNALELPLEDASFDVLSIGFGLRNLPDSKKGIQEMARVLKEGGKLFILEFSPKQRGLFGKLYRAHLKYVIPTLGGVISGSKDAYDYLATSIPSFLEPQEVLETMSSAGFQTGKAIPLFGEIAYIYEGTK